MKALVIGGNRFFGKKLVRKLIESGAQTTVLNRGSLEDGLGQHVERIRCDRKNFASLEKALRNRTWDVVYDQVCFEASEAEEICGIISNKTSHYVFTSSQSVYDYGANIKEVSFDPSTYSFSKRVASSDDYGEAKKQAEKMISEMKDLPSTLVRFPIVLGLDDYTGRLKFHIDRIRNRKPIHFPNLDAEISFIHSDDAANVLFEIGKRPAAGPVNSAAPDSISLGNMLKQVEISVGQKVRLARTPNKANHSPFGIFTHWFMDTQKQSSLGICVQPISSWLPQMIEEMADRSS